MTTAAPTAPVLPAKMLVEAPASDSNCEYTPLAYVEAYDAMLNDDYAFVAYKEASRSNPADWRVRIKSRNTAGAVFEQEAMRLQARAAGSQGKPYFVWGFTFTPSPGDCRCIEFRVHVAGGKPSTIEMFLQMRNADGSPGEQKSVQFPWPAA
jgi:hypothetical protein